MSDERIAGTVTLRVMSDVAGEYLQIDEDTSPIRLTLWADKIEVLDLRTGTA